MGAHYPVLTTIIHDFHSGIQISNFDVIYLHDETVSSLIYFSHAHASAHTHTDIYRIINN